MKTGGVKWCDASSGGASGGRHGGEGEIYAVKFVQILGLK